MAMQWIGGSVSTGLILVTAPDDVKIARFVRRCFGEGEIPEAERIELEAEARLRLARQIPDEQKIAACDYVLTNDGADRQSWSGRSINCGLFCGLRHDRRSARRGVPGGPHLATITGDEPTGSAKKETRV